MSFDDLPDLPGDDPDAEIRERLAARESESVVRLGILVLLGLGVVIAAAVVAMLVVAW